MLQAIEKLTQKDLFDLPPNSTIEIVGFFRIWKEGVPSYVRKKPNANEEKTNFWTEGWVSRRVAGRIETLDNAHVKLAIVKDSMGNREHKGRFTSANHARITEYYLMGE